MKNLGAKWKLNRLISKYGGGRKKVIKFKMQLILRVVRTLGSINLRL